MKKPKIQLVVTSNGNTTYAYPSSAKEEVWAKDLRDSEYPSDSDDYYTFQKTQEGNVYSIVVKNQGKSCALSLFTGQWKTNKGKNLIDTLHRLYAEVVEQDKRDSVNEQLYYLASTFVADTITAHDSSDCIVYTYSNNTQLEKGITNTLQREALEGKRVIFAKERSAVASAYERMAMPEKMVYTINSSKITSGVSVDKQYVAEGDKLNITYTKEEDDYLPIEVAIEIDGVSNQYLLYNGSEILIRSIISMLNFQKNIPLEPEPVVEVPVVPVVPLETAETTSPVVEVKVAPVPVVEEEHEVEEEVAEEGAVIIIDEKENEDETIPEPIIESETKHDEPQRQTRGWNWLVYPTIFIGGLACGAAAMFLFGPKQETEKLVAQNIVKKDTVVVTKNDTILRTDTFTVAGKTKTVVKKVTVYRDRETVDHFDASAYTPVGGSTRLQGYEGGNGTNATFEVQGHDPLYKGGDDAMKRAILNSSQLSNIIAKSGSPTTTLKAKFTVGSDGTVSSVEVLRCNENIKQRITNAIKRLEFEPATNGKSVTKEVNIPLK